MNFTVRGHLTITGDIYSFGVVLWETLTGQRAWEPQSLFSTFTLVEWASPFLEDKQKLKDIIDPCLKNNYPLDGAFHCLALATRCVAKDHKARPSSKQVLWRLQQIYSVNK